MYAVAVDHHTWFEFITVITIFLHWQPLTQGFI